VADSAGQLEGGASPSAVAALPAVGEGGLELSAPGVARSRLDTFGIPIALFVAAAAVYAFINQGRPARFDYFVPLADAFLHGKTGLSPLYSWLDEVVPGKNGLYYVPYPPAPAVLLMPVVAIFGTGFEQSWATIVLGATNVALMSIAIGNMGVSRRTRVVLSLAFAFGTIVWFSAQVGTAWHLEHIVAMFFMLLAILACQHDRSTFVIGLLFAGAIASRMELLLAIPFFVAYLFDRSQRERTGDRTPFGFAGGVTVLVRESRFDVLRLVDLALPMLIALAIPAVGLAAYNDARFGSIFQNGYSLLPSFQTPQYSHGLFSLAYFRSDFSGLFTSRTTVGGDFPWLFPGIKGGPSILLTSPIFLWALKSRRPDWFNVGAWTSVVIILLPMLFYADWGGIQFGFRAAQGIYPFLMLLTARGLKDRLGGLAWVAITVGFVVNFWGMAFATSGWWY
jgi:hypothetical protein